MTTVITEPGLYPDLDVEEYHADAYAGGSLSHSGAKTLLRRPAIFAWEREHGRPNKPEFDFGHAAHRVVLGDGMEIAVIPDQTLSSNGSTNTKAAKQFIAEARAAGAIPIKSDAAAVVNAMAEQLRAHPVASKLLAAGSGTAEVSAFAVDEPSGVVMRCRYDWWPREPSAGQRLILPDYKSCISADPEAFGKAAANYGYALQDAFYSTIAKNLGLASDVAFVFVCQEKDPPFLVNVVQLDVTAKRIGAVQMRRALDLYAECTRTGVWPGYPDEVALSSLPVWFEHQFELELAS